MVYKIMILNQYLSLSNHFPLDVPMLSPFPSSPSYAYMNPSFGSGGMMAPFSISSFDRSHIPQLNLIVGGWNLPSYRSNPRFTFLGESAQMGGYSSYYTPSIYPSCTLCQFLQTLFP
jgi:hypothetical protein